MVILFPNSMEKQVLNLDSFSISFEKITFYTEILTRKVELWIFFTPNFSVENNYFPI